MRLFRALLIGTTAFAAACQQPADLGEPVSIAVVIDPAEPGEIPRGGYIVQDLPGTTDPKLAAPMHRYLYVNFDGGTYTPGWNNSSENVSSIVSSTSSVPAWGSSFARSQVLSCVQDIFSPFNITVTGVDPGITPHIEAVTAGRPSDIGQGSGVGGVSPFSCGIIEQSIVFSFAEIYGSNYQELCHTVAQEAAHSFGLDHEYMCQDPMTYLNGCGDKSFQNTNAPCGEFSSRTCMCGGSTQNSVQMLLEALGPDGAGIPPTVMITSPANGATVTAGFTVNVSANDDEAVTRVELYVGGQLLGTDTSAPYSFTTPTNVGNGQTNIQARAYDGTDVSTHAVGVNVTGGSDGGGGGDECDAGNPCVAGFACDDGTCVPDGGGGGGGDGAVGQPCTEGAQCNSGLCLVAGDEGYCTETCLDDNGCPSGTECTPTSGAESVCWPAEDTDDGVGGGCSVAVSAGRSGSAAPGSGSAAALWLMAIVGFVALRRRRRA